MPLNAPTASAAIRATIADRAKLLPPDIMTLRTIADRTTVDPTDKSIPPEAMTTVMPMAMIATKVKLRSTLNILR
jgi:hypothetical protein